MTTEKVVLSSFKLKPSILKKAGTQKFKCSKGGVKTLGLYVAKLGGLTLSKMGVS